MDNTDLDPVDEGACDSVPPLVSVIIPCYNGADYIRQTIESVMAQSYSPIEILVVDDGSTDESRYIAQGYAETSKNVQVIEKENGGLASARNAGINAAKGQFLAFLDSDDFWHPEKVALHVAHFQKSGSDREAIPLGVSYASTRFVDENGRRLKHRRRPKRSRLSDYDLYCRNPITNGSNAVFHRDVFSAIRFDETLERNQDIDCWLRIAFGSAQKWRFEGIDEELTYYRVNGSGLSADYAPHYECCQRTWKKSLSYAPEVAKKYAAISAAFQFRFYARRSVGAGDYGSARKYVLRALREAPSILLREPLSTIATVICAFLKMRI